MAWRISRRRAAITLARSLGVAALAGAARASELERFEAIEPHMGTMFRIVLYAPDTDAARTAFRAAFDEIGRLDAALSDYRDDSEINRLCRAPAGRPTPVSDALWQALTLSLEIAEKTDGAFDVTLGPLIRLWRKARKAGRLPEPAERERALAACGYRKLRLDHDRTTVTFAAPGMQLDLGGVAKGLSADRALAELGRLGVRSALIAAGGDIRVGEPPPGKSAWKVGIQGLNASGEKQSEIVALENGAVSTSGDAEQFVEIGGIRYSHIVDPVTGVGLTERLTATVISSRGATSDAWATAVSVLGSEVGLARVAEEPGVQALVIRPRDSGFDRIGTPGFPMDRL